MCFWIWGVQLRIEKDKIIQKAPKKLESIHIVRTMPYPGFPTDIQSPFMALATVARGTSVFIENIFENRFQHIDELTRMGADIKVEGRSAVVRGVNTLQGANVVAKGTARRRITCCCGTCRKRYNDD